MQKFLSSIALVAVIVVGLPVASASAAVSCAYPDHAVYGDDANRSIVTSCISSVTWDINMKAAEDLQKTGYHFGRLQSVTLKNGTVETCPFWYWSGCVIDRSLIR